MQPAKTTLFDPLTGDDTTTPPGQLVPATPGAVHGPPCHLCGDLHASGFAHGPASKARLESAIKSAAALASEAAALLRKPDGTLRKTPPRDDNTPASTVAAIAHARIKCQIGRAIMATINATPLEKAAADALVAAIDEANT